MDNEKLDIVLISNIVLEPYLRAELGQIFQKVNRQENLYYLAYDEAVGKGAELEFQDADIILILLNFEIFYPNCINDIYSGKVSQDEVRVDVLKKSKGLYQTLAKKGTVPIVWFGFEDYGYNCEYVMGNLTVAQGIVDKINLELNELISGQNTFVDLKRLIAKIGIVNAYNKKGKYRWNAPYSKELISVICEEVLKQYLIHMGVTKKCIVLDCDNVIWGGILSEDGIEGIRVGSNGLGHPFQDFQRFLLTLYYHGVILAVSSKNDEEDVLKVFREHSGMMLKEEQIACFQVNWDNKPENIRKIASELNIGLDSMVFVDDSEFEIHLVGSVLPEVTTILFDRNTIYKQLSCFNLKSDVDRECVEWRVDTYRMNVQRNALCEASSSYDEYLKNLGSVTDIHPARPSEFARIAELTQRTNKCTNGIRYTIEQLKKKLQNEKYILYSVSLYDKFSNLGLVGTIGIDGYILDLFSLSCRAVGRSVEERMLEIVKENNVQGYCFVTTGKNNELECKLIDALSKEE